MKKTLLILIFIFSSCAYKPKPDVKPFSFLETHPLDTTKVRFDGYYTEIPDTIVYANGYQYKLKRHFAHGLSVLAKNKKIYSYEGILDNKEPLKCDFYEEERNRIKKNGAELDKFTIKNDSLYTTGYALVTIWGGRKYPIFCNFRGFVKNRDTITDWKIVPPYPKDFTKFVFTNNDHLLKPHTLYFVKTDAVKCLKMD